MPHLIDVINIHDGEFILFIFFGRGERRLNPAASQLLSGGESSEHEALHFFSSLFFVMLHGNLEMSGSNSRLFGRAQKNSEVALGAKSSSLLVNRCRGRPAGVQLTWPHTHTHSSTGHRNTQPFSRR